MILSICCNPCIDRYLFVEKLVPYELNRIRSEYDSFAGKGLNVAKTLSQLGAKSLATGFMYKEDSVRFISNLNDYKVESNFVELNGSVRVNLKVLDAIGITEINKSGENVPLNKQEDLLELVKVLSSNMECAVISGSLPKGVSDDYYKKIASVLQCPFVIDSEGDRLLSALPYHPEIIKPNLFELENIFKEKLTVEGMVRASRKLIDMGAKSVLLSLGRDGGMLITKSRVLSASVPLIQVVSATGAGDSMLSAALLAKLNGDSDEEILRAGVAAGSAACLTVGTTPLKKSDYDRLLKDVKVTELEL